jgi:outer membrane immunogenic protein
MTRKTASIAALALVLSAGLASAADLPSRKGPPMLPPPPPPPLWTGFYAGLNAGGTWSNSNSFDVASFPGSCTSNGGGCTIQPNFGVTSALLATFVAPVGSNGGFIGGGQIGYNWQFYNNFVAGIEADIQGIASSHSATSLAGIGINPVFGAGVPIAQVASVSRSLDYIGTVRGRLGWLFTPTLLVYGTGGLAYGGVNTNASIMQQVLNVGDIPNPYFGGGAFSDTRVGWTAGGGLEWMFMPNWSAKVEYFYYDLGNVTYALSPLVNIPANGTIFSSAFSQAQTRFNGNIVRAGLNYHFHWGSAPVVAKY